MREMLAVPPSKGSWEPPAGLAGIQRTALLVGIVGLAATAVGGYLQPEQFFRSYLVAFLYWLVIPLGCLGLSMIHHLSGGAWGVMMRRINEAASRTIPLLALFFVPLLFGLRDLYRWARPEIVAADEHMQHQAPYLNVRFFIVRAAIYFVIWSLLALGLSRLSARQDRTGDRGAAAGMSRISAPGLILFFLTLTFAAIDWLMSLDSHWHSTIYGVYLAGGAAISSLAFVILVSLYLSGREPMSGAFRPAHFHDYGKFLLAFVVLWAYFNTSQLIIIWQGQISDEITWYQPRLAGAWRYVSVGLVLLHFVLPFFLLLSRDLKRNVRRLAVVALLLLVMRWVDLWWLAAPALSPDGVSFHWLDLVAPLGLGGIWVALFTAELRRRPLLPAGEPHLAEALAHE